MGLKVVADLDSGRYALLNDQCVYNRQAAVRSGDSGKGLSCVRQSALSCD